MRYILSIIFFSFLWSVNAVTIADAGNNIDVCVGNAFFVEGNSPGANETAYWIDLDGFIESPGDTIWGSEIEQGFPELGEYNLSFEITDGVEVSKASLMVTVIDVPDFSNAAITFPDGCEGDVVEAMVSGLNGISNIEFNWFDNTNNESLPSSSNKTQVLIQNTNTTMDIEVNGSNECGTSESIKATNNIKFTPTETPVIEGKSVLCSTKSEIFTVIGNDATSFLWKWNGVVKGSNTNKLSLNSQDFQDINSGSLIVTSQNECGPGLSASFKVDVVNPVEIDVTITSAAENEKICIDEEVTFTATSNAGTGGGLVPEYRFFIGSAEVQALSFSNTYNVVSGDLTDGTVVQVEIVGDPNGCYASITNVASITVDAYFRPATVLSSDKVEVCELTENITLSIAGLDKGDAVLNWTKEGNEIPDFVDEILVLSEATGRGAYGVEVGNEICSGTSTSEISVMLFEQPSIETLQFVNPVTNQLDLFFENELDTLTETYSVQISGLNNDVGLTDSYLWKSNEVSLKSIEGGVELVAVGDLKLDTVTFVVSNGLCMDSLSFRVVGMLPDGVDDELFVKNAIYPNPLSQGEILLLSEEFKGASIQFYNLEGQLMFSKEEEVDGEIEGVVKGEYVVKLKKKGKNYVSKLIVE